jgi:hypothetical protein
MKRARLGCTEWLANRITYPHSMPRRQNRGIFVPAACQSCVPGHREFAHQATIQIPIMPLAEWPFGRTFDQLIGPVMSLCV